jgi:hypothetical protein
MDDAHGGKDGNPGRTGAIAASLRLRTHSHAPDSRAAPSLLVFALAAAVNRHRVGAARIVDLPKTGHDLDTYPSLGDQLNDLNASYRPPVDQEVLTWLRAH